MSTGKRLTDGVRPPVKTRHHMAVALHPTPAVIKGAMVEVDGFNAKFAVLITKVVGSMWCAYVFALLAVVGLPAALSPGGSGLVPWIAQTFLQLVLLSVIMVGQSVQSAASDARSVQEFENTKQILDALDVKTAGGLTEVLDAVKALDETRQEGVSREGVPVPHSDCCDAGVHAAVSWTYVHDHGLQSLHHIRRALKEPRGWWTGSDEAEYRKAMDAPAPGQ